MRIFLAIKLAIRNLHSNKGRTALSLLGIVIGVTAVILIVSLGGGLRSFVVSQVETFGTDIIEIEIKVPKTAQLSAGNIGGMAGGAQVTTLKIDDMEKVSKLSNLKGWYGGILGQEIASYKDKTEQALLFGVTASILKVDDGAELERGVMFSEKDNNNLKQVVVLGSKLKEHFFDDRKAIGKNIKIKGQKYRVIGVMKERGSMGGFDFDNLIFIPIKTLQKKIMGISYIQFAIFKVADMEKVDQTMEEVRTVLRREHKIEYDNEKDLAKGLDDDFAVISIAEAKDILDQVFSIINALLLSLASISLVVGGVGIMNVMYVAVTERTKEIGLRKSVGASNSDILWQFIFESILLTFIGGVLGVLLGFALSQLAGYIVSQIGFNVKFEVTFMAVVVSCVFSALLGGFFGFYPARSATKITPIEAIRKE